MTIKKPGFASTFGRCFKRKITKIIVLISTYDVHTEKLKYVCEFFIVSIDEYNIIQEQRYYVGML